MRNGVPRCEEAYRCLKDFPPGELILRPERRRLVPLGEATIWRMERRGEFPRRIAISAKRVAWRKSEIETWLEKRATASLPPFLQRLLEEIAAANDATEAAALAHRCDELDALPEIERERALELIEDAIRQHSELPGEPRTPGAGQLPSARDTEEQVNVKTINRKTPAANVRADRRRAKSPGKKIGRGQKSRRRAATRT